ncbi:MAG: hypothetical protein ACRCZD_04785 [Phycicoccus sp.]
MSGGSVTITPANAQTASQAIGQFGNEFKKEVIHLQDLISGANASQSGNFSGSITTASATLATISENVERVLVEMGRLVGDAAVNYSTTDDFTSDSVGSITKQMGDLIQ